MTTTDHAFRDDCVGDPYAPKAPHHPAAHKRVRAVEAGQGGQGGYHDAPHFGGHDPYVGGAGGRWDERHGARRRGEGYERGEGYARGEGFDEWRGQLVGGGGGGYGRGGGEGAYGNGHGREGDGRFHDGYGRERHFDDRRLQGRHDGYSRDEEAGERFRGSYPDGGRNGHPNEGRNGHPEDGRYRHYRNYDDHEAGNSGQDFAGAPAEYAGVAGYEDLPVSFGNPRADHGAPPHARKRARYGEYEDRHGYDYADGEEEEGGYEWADANDDCGEWDEGAAENVDACQPVGKRERENKQMGKYWAQRYRLFSRFDDGIKMDRVSWYSVTPEKIAHHIATRFRDAGMRVIVDAFCGAAGNAIQFAGVCGGLTIAVELCQSRLEIARHNAGVYGVESSIDFVNGDAYKVMPNLQRVDAVFLSPPWGGPTYVDGKYRLEVFKDIVEAARKVTENVAILVPKNISHEDAVSVFGKCEIEENYLGGRLKTVTIYFGGLVRESKVASSEGWEEEED